MPGGGGWTFPTILTCETGETLRETVVVRIGLRLLYINFNARLRHGVLHRLCMHNNVCVRVSADAHALTVL